MTSEKQYHEHRRHIMLTRQEGLTKTYNRFHDPDETADDIQKLRELHVEMDNAVAAAYGWTDLDLGHGFHETKQGVRFTISEPARREVLARLLKLNHERYAEEVKQGLHDKGRRRHTRGGRDGPRRTVQHYSEALLLSEGSTPCSSFLIPPKRTRIPGWTSPASRCCSALPPNGPAGWLYPRSCLRKPSIITENHYRMPYERQERRRRVVNKVAPGSVDERSFRY